MKLSRRLNRSRLLGLAVVIAAFAANDSIAQTSIKMEIRGYLCRQPVDAKDFQHLASTNPKLARYEALWRFNRTRAEPRCQWYEPTLMIFKGALKKPRSDSQSPTKHLFVGGAGGLFEVLVYQTPDGTSTLYSWRRIASDAG